ncbi:MAG: pyruvate ferredoxin oxidoreductase [Nanoarchaeota archaeon]|nr:pyruvate ferredoxin oxidoreductase [Nanoarchaeota archaeon]
MIKGLDGAGAASEAMRQINPDVVAAYPITPQTAVVENYAKFLADGLVSGEMIRVESEHSAMSACVGASAAGARVMTATSSAGLALMWEILGVASGLRLPVVMNVVNRALSGPINIHCDHSDSMGCRDQGWIQIYCEDAQEVYDFNLLAVKLSEKVKLPVMVMQDGFITSHSLQRMETLKDKDVKKFVGDYKFESSLLNVDKPITHGPLQLFDYYFETKKQLSDSIEKSKVDYLKIGRELSNLTKRKYSYFEEYKLKDSEVVIVVLSSTAGAVKEVIDGLREKGKKVGLLKINLFRPFPYKEVENALKHVKNIAVLDRSESYGGNAPLFSEIKNSLFDVKTKINSYIFGLGGREIYEKDIENVFEELLSNKIKNRYVGLR